MADIQSLFFTKLPREIRDKIYECSFESEQGAPTKIIPLSEWIEKDRMARRTKDNPTLVPAPTCPLYRFLINHQFFEEASAAYLRVHSIECHYNFKGIFAESSILKANLTLLTSTWGRIWGPYMTFDILGSCISLRELRLYIGDCVFDDIANKMSYQDSYVDADYQAIQHLRRLLAIPALETVKLLPVESEMAKTDEEQAIWKRNVSDLEAYVNRTVKQLREAEKPGAKQQALQQGAGRAWQLLSPFLMAPTASLPTLDELATNPFRMPMPPGLPAPPTLLPGRTTSPPILAQRARTPFRVAPTPPTPKRTSRAKAPQPSTTPGAKPATPSRSGTSVDGSKSAQASQISARVSLAKLHTNSSIMTTIAATSLILTFINTIILLVIICRAQS